MEKLLCTEHERVRGFGVAGGFRKAHFFDHVHGALGEFVVACVVGDDLDVGGEASGGDDPCDHDFSSDGGSYFARVLMAFVDEGRVCAEDFVNLFL